MALFDARDFGANPYDNLDDTASIQAALDAAHASGGGQVYLAAGTYTISGTGTASDGALRVYSNTEFFGDGMGQTILKLADGWSSKITGLIRTPVNEVTHDVVIRDLTLDGNRDNTTADVDGIMTGVLPGKAEYDARILIENVEIHDVSRIAFNPHEQTQDLIIRDCVAHDNSWDGFIADFVTNAIYENNVAYNNDRHGFNVVTHSSEVVLQNNVSYDNGENGIVIQRGAGSQSIDGWQNMLVHDVLVQNNEVFGNGSNGILLKQAEGIQVINNTIYDNGADGVQLEGAHDSLVADNIITAMINGIEIRAYTGSLPGPDVSYNNVIADNLIIAGNYVLDENHTSTVNNTFSGNLIGEQATSLNAGSVNTVEMDMVTYTVLDITVHLPLNYTGIDPMASLDESLATDPVVTDTTTTDPVQQAPAAQDPLVQEAVVQEAVLGGIAPEPAAPVPVVVAEKLFLSGDGGDNTLAGGAGDDTLKGRSGDDVLYGGAGDDYLEGNGGDDVLYGGLGADRLKGSGGVDTYAFRDISEGGDHILDFRVGEKIDLHDVLDDVSGFNAARAFDDGFIRMVQNGADVQLFIDMDGYGGTMQEQLFLTLDDAKVGDITPDSFILPETLVVAAVEPAPVVQESVVQESAPVVAPVVALSTDPVNLDGSSSADTLEGMDGSDLLKGRGGGDVLVGHGGDDVLWGNDGNDMLYGGAGADWMKGGDGADTFVFGQGVFDGVDTVKDFRSNDIIEIRDVLFGFDPLSDAINDFVSFTQSGKNSIMSIDTDGAANGANFVEVAVFSGTSGLDATQLYDDGDLVITNLAII